MSCNWRNADITRLASVYPQLVPNGILLQVWQPGEGRFEYKIPGEDFAEYAAAIQNVTIEANSVRWAKQQRGILRACGVNIPADPPTWTHDARAAAYNRWP